MPVASKVVVKPEATCVTGEKSVIDLSVAGDTVTFKLVLIAATVAKIETVPGEILSTSPVSEILATSIFDDSHTTELSRFSVLLSVYLPTTFSCWEDAIARVIEVGEILKSIKDLTVTLRSIDCPSNTANTLEVPGEMVVNKPVFDTSIIAESETDQVTNEVKFCEVPSEYVPVTVS